MLIKIGRGISKLYELVPDTRIGKFAFHRIIHEKMLHKFFNVR